MSDQLTKEKLQEIARMMDDAPADDNRKMVITKYMADLHNVYETEMYKEGRILIIEAPQW